MEEADLLSYLLFDGEFAAEIMALGESDARARSDELCELFEDAVRQ
jgi:NTE family protein